MIKRGWDWLGMMPAVADRVSGLIEAPDLAASLTLNKADFLRSGPRGASFLAYRKAMQEAVSAQLAQWGDAERGDLPQHRRVARPSSATWSRCSPVSPTSFRCSQCS